MKLDLIFAHEISTLKYQLAHLVPSTVFVKSLLDSFLFFTDMTMNKLLTQSTVFACHFFAE